MTTKAGLAAQTMARPWLTPLALTLIAAAVRLFWIDRPMLWADETFTWTYTRETFAHHLALDRTTDLHPPLHPVMLKLWIAQFGDSRTAMRSLSVLFGALTLPALYLIARNWTGTRIAIIAGIFFALNPISIHFSRETRAYAALSFFLLWAIYFFLEVARKRQLGSGRVGWQITGFAVCLAATFHLHYISILLFPLFGLATLLLAIVERDRKLFILLAAATTGAAILCIPQAVHFFGYATQGGSVRNEWMQATTWSIFRSQTLGAYPFPSVTKVLMAAAYLYGGWRLWRISRPLSAVVFTFVVIAPLLVATVGIIRPLYLVRSIQCFTTLSPLLLAAALAALSNRLLAPAILLLGGIHIWAASPNYPSARIANPGEAITEALAGHERDIVYYDANLGPELAAYRVDVRQWQPLRLSQPGADAPLIAKHLAACAMPTASCPATTVIMEQSPLFEKRAGAAWAKALDAVAKKHPPESDRVLSNYRILHFP